MSDLTNKILAAAAADARPAPARIARQLLYIERAMDRDELDAGQRNFLCASFQALNWARSPDDFAAPVQNVGDWASPDIEPRNP